MNFTEIRSFRPFGLGEEGPNEPGAGPAGDGGVDWTEASSAGAGDEGKKPSEQE